MNDTTETSKPLKRKRESLPSRTYVDVAKDLSKQEQKQSNQRAELAATDATIDGLRQELKDLMNEVGKKK